VFEQPRDTKGGVLVDVKTIVPADRLQFIQAGEASVARVDIYVSIFDEDGHNISLTRLTRDANIPKGEAQAGTFAETTAVRLAKGKQYRVVVAVRDQLGDSVGVTQQLVRF
ncbi:MAG TPA: hypothetical protein VKL19_15175, partial [Thermoanaerobaculia bacterium]|nr:hypothetical protein [Thermoanaerobaculia bacterium]